MSKVDELRAWMDTCDWDVAVVTETWLREGQGWQLNVPGYRCYRRDRGGGERGGLLLYRFTENVTAAAQNYIIDGSSSVVTWVKLRNEQGMITLLGVYYRSPDNQ